MLDAWEALAGERPAWMGPALATAACALFASTFSATLTIVRGIATSREAASDPPQAILVLGGDREREAAAARFAAGGAAAGEALQKLSSSSPHAAGALQLPVYVSSAHDDVAEVMRRAGVPPARLHLDNVALDTVTNFTSMLPTFQREHISHVYVVTSEYHMRRACAVASLVLATHGIACTPVRLPSSPSSSSSSPAAAQEARRRAAAETRLRLERDRCRALLWLLTGWHGAELLRFTKPARYKNHKRKPLHPKGD